MKKLYVLTLFITLNISSFAQDTTGLIAHWDMNGSVNDVSGNEHNGTANYLTTAAGKDGIMGHGYYFNGENSVITVPYSSAFNITKTSFCATLKVSGFYTGHCQSNILLARGQANVTNGSYYFMFTDKAGDNYDCDSYDTTVEVFQGNVNDNIPALETDYNYVPYIVEDSWYSVVITFDDTAYKTYVNGVVKNVAYVTSPGEVVPTSTDSISIGYDLFDAPYGFPYGFKGIMDDILLYNRVLTDSEINVYTTSTTLAIKSIEKEIGGISIYPNPASDFIDIASDNQISGDAIVVISDLLGHAVLRTEMGGSLVRISIAHLTPGMYIMTIGSRAQFATKKFIKK